MRMIPIVCVVALLAPAHVALGHTGGRQADLFAGGTLEGERYWDPDPGCDPDWDNEHTQVTGGGALAFLPHSGCGLTYTTVFVHNDGWFSQFSARLNSGTGHDVTARIAVRVDDKLVATGTIGSSSSFVLDDFTGQSCARRGTRKIRVEYTVVSGPIWSNLEVNYLTFQSARECGGGRPWFAGWTCGLTTSNDTSGILQQNRDTQIGAVTGGPWLAYHSSVGGSGSGGDVYAEPMTILMHCWVQVNNPTPTHDSSSSFSHCDVSGPGLASSQCQVAYLAGPTDNVYLCTSVEMSYGDMTHVYTYDDDGEAWNGVQCAIALSTGGDNAGVASWQRFAWSGAAPGA